MVTKSQIIFPDGSSLQDAYDAGGIPDPLITYLNLNGNKIYLKKESTDALSTYIWYNASGNLEFHVPSGKSIEWKVG